MAVYEASIYAWRQRFGKMVNNDVKRLKASESESARASVLSRLAGRPTQPPLADRLRVLRVLRMVRQHVVDLRRIGLHDTPAPRPEPASGIDRAHPCVKRH